MTEYGEDDGEDDGEVFGQTPPPVRKTDPFNFQLSNNFRQGVRSVIGRRPKFAGPEELAAAVDGYFQWVARNPFYAAETTNYKGRARMHAAPRARFMTIGEMQRHIGVCSTTWNTWQQEGHPGHRPDLVPVIKMAERVIKEYTLSGTTAGFFKEGIVSKWLGLAERNHSEGSEGNGLDAAPTIVIQAIDAEDATDAEP